MKSIFKKIAFVLALAMVVTAFPAQTAGAAASGPQLKAHRVLYLGGDVTETYGEKAYATVWNFKEDGYTVKFETKNPEIATVGASKGMITAVSVGTTTVTATFSKKGERDIVKECKVEVKRNASAVALTEESEKAIEALTVGDTVKLAAVATNGDNKVTDFIKFESDNKDIVTVDKKTGELTAVAAGKAKVTVYTHQYEYNFTSKKYTSERSAERTYEVEVANAKLEAEQTAWNAVTITFGSDEDAKTAIEATKPSLSNPEAAVTENKEIIKLYKVLKNSNNSEKTVYFSGFSQSGNKVIGTLFEEMDEDTDYIVRYQDQVVSLKTGKYVADSMSVYASGYESLGEDSSKTTIGFSLFTTGVNGQKVDITGAKIYTGWQASVDLEDLNKEPYHAEYTFDATARIIWFFTKSESYTVSLKATFDDWYTATGSTAKTLTAYEYIHPGDLSSVVGKIIDWGIVDYGTHIENNDKAFNLKAFAAEDNGSQLVVQISYKNAGNDTKVNSCDSSLFEFVSSNDDKLAINKDTGELYPPKEPVDGTVLVHVYYDKQYVGSCPVRIYAKRVFYGFTAELSSSKLNFNSDATKDVDDTLTLTLKPVDQLGAPFNNVEGKAELNGATSGDYINLQGSGLSWTVSAKKDPVKLTKTAMTFRIVCTATYDDGQSPKITKKYSVAFTAKDTNGMEAKSYKLVGSCNDNKVDMNLDNSSVAAKKVSISAFSYDRDGFKIEKLPLAAAYKEADLQAGKNVASVAIRLGNDYVDINHLAAEDTKTLVFSTVLDHQTDKITTVSGSAIEANNVITKVKEGTYSVNLFIGNASKAVYKHSLPIEIKDSQPKPAWTWTHYTTAAADVMSAVHDCFKFMLNGNDVTLSQILIRTDEKEGDYMLKGNTLTIQRVRRIVEIGDQVFEQVIDIKRPVTINVPQ